LRRCTVGIGWTYVPARNWEQHFNQLKENRMQNQETLNQESSTLTFTKMAPPEWLLAFWKGIDDKTFGQGLTAWWRMPRAGLALRSGVGASQRGTEMKG
jgi:hypothetical protein